MGACVLEIVADARFVCVCVRVFCVYAHVCTCVLSIHECIVNAEVFLVNAFGVSPLVLCACTLSNIIYVPGCVCSCAYVDCVRKLSVIQRILQTCAFSVVPMGFLCTCACCMCAQVMYVRV